MAHVRFLIRKERSMAFDTPLIPGANPRLSVDHVRAAAAGIRLVGQTCNDCGKSLFPRTGVCPGCQSVNLSDSEMPDHGVLYSWSVVHVAPKPWTTPYVIGYVDLPNQVRVFSHIGGTPEDLQVDMPVRLEAVAAGSGGDAGGQPLFRFSPVQKETL
jgi:uncharacterized OB-fold protein